MSTIIKCPNCSHEFELNESLREGVKKELRDEMKEWQRKKEEAFNTQLGEERKKIQQETEQAVRKNIASDYENKLRLLDQTNKDNEEKLKLARQQQLEYLKKEQELKTKEEELELSVQKKVVAEREKL